MRISDWSSDVCSSDLSGSGLGEAEAADPVARRQSGQIFPLLLLRAVGVDRVHHEARLDAHHRAIARIDPLDLARDEAVGDVTRGAPAIVGRDRQSVVSGKSAAVPVDRGCRRSLNKTKTILPQTPKA